MVKKSKEKIKTEEKKLLLDNPSFFSRFLGPIRALIKLHLKIASNEFKNDVKRLISGIINLVIGIFSIIICWILLNILAVAGLKNFFNELYSILIVASANLFIAIIMFISAGINFKKPFLKETKKVIKDTFEDMKL